jgi:hypothetical protein
MGSERHSGGLSLRASGPCRLRLHSCKKMAPNVTAKNPGKGKNRKAILTISFLPRERSGKREDYVNMYCTAYKSIKERPEAEFMTYNFVKVSGNNL